MVAESKTCPECGEEKAGSAFHRDNARHDGLFRICKACSRGHRRTVSFRPKVLEGIHALAKKYECSCSAVIEMLVLDALEDERIKIKDWGGRLAEERWDA